MTVAADILDRQFWNKPETYRQRVDRAQMRRLLLENEPVIAHGSLWDIRHTHIDLGVYEIWLEKRSYGGTINEDSS